MISFELFGIYWGICQRAMYKTPTSPTDRQDLSRGLLFSVTVIHLGREVVKSGWSNYMEAYKGTSNSLPSHPTVMVMMPVWEKTREHCCVRILYQPWKSWHSKMNVKIPLKNFTWMDRHNLKQIQSAKSIKISFFSIVFSLVQFQCRTLGEFLLFCDLWQYKQRESVSRWQLHRSSFSHLIQSC